MFCIILEVLRQRDNKNIFTTSSWKSVCDNDIHNSCNIRNKRMVEHSLYAIVFQKSWSKKCPSSCFIFKMPMREIQVNSVHFHHNLVSVSAFYLAASGAQTEIGGFGKFRECLAIASLGASVQPLS